MKTSAFIACHECDLLHRLPALPEGGLAKCTRCQAVIYQHKRNSLNRTLALTVSAVVFLVLANTFPFLALKMEGQLQETILLTGVLELSQQGRTEIAMLVFITSMLLPALQILFMLYILMPLKYDCLPPQLARVFRVYQTIRPWSMMEVFMLGILVSAAKLADMATVVPGIAVYSFMILIFLLAAITWSLDPHLIWEKLDINT
jgi:paraquat-inducible protein A